ncbi:Helicase C-terminal [Penicillium canescens]|nr:Helicase C-terminal [Penicillium canescens]
MTEKERGVLEGADFPSLWEVLPNFDGEVRPPTNDEKLSLGGNARYHGQIRTVVFHGPNRHKLSSGLLNNDIVLTTYDTLRSEWSSGSTNSVLFSHSEGWARVILDEAHHIRSRCSQTFQAACEVRARYRWCLTGTPIQNRLEDYAALVSFIGVPPFTGRLGKTSFAEWVSTPIHTADTHARGIRRLRNLVAATCLRRTKSHLQDQLELPPRVEKEQSVELDPWERSLYDFLKSRASSLVVGKVTQRSQMDKARWGTMLSLIGFLRLVCNHGQQLLPPVATELYQERNPSAPGLYSDKTDFDIGVLEGASISNKASLPLTPTMPREVMESDYRPSSKVNALLKNLQNEQRDNQSLSDEAPVKSFWTKMLDLLEVALRANNFLFQRIDGKTPLEKRSQALKSFSEDPSCTVMLASIGSVAEGVDLTAANFVHLVEPQWNPMVEAQATDRVHRIGQLRDVVVTRYIVKNSIEQSFGDQTTGELVLSETRFQRSGIKALFSPLVLQIQNGLQYGFMS